MQRLIAARDLGFRVLVITDPGLAAIVRDAVALLERGVLVRDVGIPGHLRVTAGTPAETTAFLLVTIAEIALQAEKMLGVAE